MSFPAQMMRRSGSAANAPFDDGCALAVSYSRSLRRDAAVELWCWSWMASKRSASTRLPFSLMNSTSLPAWIGGAWLEPLRGQGEGGKQAPGVGAWSSAWPAAPSAPGHHQRRTADQHGEMADLVDLAGSVRVMASSSRVGVDTFMLPNSADRIDPQGLRLVKVVRRASRLARCLDSSASLDSWRRSRGRRWC